MSLSGASIPEIVEKCDRFDAFPGASDKYLVETEEAYQKRHLRNEKRATYDVTPDYVTEAIR